jgi:hypothetical protein
MSWDCDLEQPSGRRIRLGRRRKRACRDSPALTVETVLIVIVSNPLEDEFDQDRDECKHVVILLR